MIAASTTSLIVPPCASRTLRWSARSVRTVTTRRCCESGPMIGDSERGVRLVSASTTRPVVRAPAAAPRSTAPVVVRTVSTTVSGSVAESLTAPAISENGDGARRGLPVVGAELLGLGAGVEQHLAEVDGVDAVDEHVVRLGQQGELAVGETLDRRRSPTADGCGPAGGRRSGRPARGAARGCPGAAAPSGVRGSRCRSARRRPRPGWRAGPARPGSAGGSAGRTRCGPGPARPAGGSRSRTRRARRSRRSRCASGSTATPRPAGPRRAGGAAHSSAALSSGLPYRRLRTTWDSDRRHRRQAGPARNRREGCTMRRSLAAAAVVLATLTFATACGSEDKPSSDSGSSDPKVIKVTFDGDTVTPNGERVEVATGQDIQLDVTADEAGEIHVHSSPEQELEYKAGESDADDHGHRPARHRRRRVALAGEGHRPARSQLRCPPTASRSPTGSAAPRTCRSRPSWRSPARPPPWSSRSRSSRSPGASRGTTPRRQRPPRAGLAGRHRRLHLVAGAVARGRLRALRVRRGRRHPRQGPRHQPVLRGVLRVVVGGPGPALAALRPGVEGDQPGPHHQPRVREGLRQRPRARRLHLPRAARALAGGARSLRVRLARAGLPLLDRARPGAAVGRGVRRGDAGRRRALRQRLLRAGRPVRGLLDAGRRGCRPGAAATACS